MRRACWLLLVGVVALGTCPGARAQPSSERAQSSAEKAADAGVSAPPPLLPVRTEVRLLTLQRDLAALSHLDDRRVLLGVGKIVVGCTAFALGLVLDEPAITSALTLAGATSVALGTAQLGSPARAHDLTSAFSSMPSDEGAQVTEAVERGEQSLRLLARIARRRRLTEASVTMIGAAAFVPLYTWLARREDGDHRFGDEPFDVVSLGSSALAFAAGLVLSLVASPAERHWAHYRERVRVFERESPGELERLRRPTLAILPARHGASLALRLHFAGL